MKDRQQTPERNPFFLRAGDQVAIAVVLVVLGVIVGLTIARYAWQNDGLVHFDRLPENEYSFQVDINRADWTEISALPNIGETIARRIVQDRQDNGPFTSLESLTRVNGIGQKTIQKIAPYLTEFSVSEDWIAGSTRD